METCLKASTDSLSEVDSVTCDHKGALLGHSSLCNGPRQNIHICSNTSIPLPGNGRSFLILSMGNLLFNFTFHLDASTTGKLLQTSILNVSCEAEERANTACFRCAGNMTCILISHETISSCCCGIVVISCEVEVVIYERETPDDKEMWIDIEVEKWEKKGRVVKHRKEKKGDYIFPYTSSLQVLLKMEGSTGETKKIG